MWCGLNTRFLSQRFDVGRFVSTRSYHSRIEQCHPDHTLARAMIRKSGDPQLRGLITGAQGALEDGSSTATITSVGPERHNRNPLPATTARLYQQRTDVSETESTPARFL